jgi:hypothetical protein
MRRVCPPPSRAPHPGKRSIRSDAARLDWGSPFRDVVLEKAGEIFRAAPLRSDGLDTETMQPVAERPCIQRRDRRPVELL